ncbi:cupin domain-containing protein [uncultured Mucilaginibacter sp.]|uniref:cupin domain-containing protein n=1 Tax=uncultured Mucilaginibacter sp. TaxID=797541 RepID=UPI0025F23746|nr:cupin domain-containing protein [uncultured Mucilaginibacter sp.]
MDNNNENNLTNSPLLAAVSKSNCINQYTWGDGCYGWNFVETDALSIKQELMPPDTSEKLHYHEKANQFFFILSGKANFIIDGIEHILKPNEGIEVKAGQKHLIGNKNDSDLEFILYSQPSTKNDRITP